MVKRGKVKEKDPSKLTEVPQQTLNRPSGSISQRANGVSLNLLGQLLKHLNLPLVSPSNDKAIHHLLEPGGTLAARSALSARLVLVELYMGEA